MVGIEGILVVGYQRNTNFFLFLQKSFWHQPKSFPFSHAPNFVESGVSTLNLE